MGRNAHSGCAFGATAAGREWGVCVAAEGSNLAADQVAVTSGEDAGFNPGGELDLPTVLKVVARDNERESRTARRRRSSTRASPVRRLRARAASWRTAAFAAGPEKGGPDHEEPPLRDQEGTQLRPRRMWRRYPPNQDLHVGVDDPVARGIAMPHRRVARSIDEARNRRRARTCSDANGSPVVPLPAKRSSVPAGSVASASNSRTTRLDSLATVFSLSHKRPPRQHCRRGGTALACSQGRDRDPGTFVTPQYRIPLHIRDRQPHLVQTVRSDRKDGCELD